MRRSAARSTSSTRAAATSLRRSRTPRASKPHSDASRSASTRTSCSRRRCSSSRTRTCSSSLPSRATSSPGAGRKPRPNGGSCSARRSPARVRARRAKPGRAAPGFPDAQAIRDEIARVVPFYRGIERLREGGDQFQWGGERLCDGGVFPTGDGRAHFSVIRPEEISLGVDEFILSTRRGKQFNTMVWASVDPLTGAERDALFVSRDDAALLGLADGRSVTVRSATGEVAARVKVAPIRQRNVQMFFPEANALLARGRADEASGVPDYNV